MPGRRPRTEVIAPSPHKLSPNDLKLSTGELVHMLRLRNHYGSHQELSDAARKYLPEWITMNRRIIQQIEKGDIPPDQINDVWLLAIAAATRTTPDVFGIKRGKSEDLDKLVNLFIRFGWCVKPT